MTVFSRRQAITGTAAAVAVTAIPSAAAAAPAGDAELLALYSRWREHQEIRFAAEMECRRIADEKPEDVESLPKVHVMGNNFYLPEHLDEYLEQTAARAHEMEFGDDKYRVIAGRGLRKMLEQVAHETPHPRDVLKEMHARYDAWAERTGLREYEDLRDEADDEAFDLEERIAALPATTPAGQLAKVDTGLTKTGARLHEDDPAWAVLASLIRDLESVTGMKAIAPAHCYAYRKT
ncbi:hypothetical protein [Caenispirillum salinarum]|uniref:hypothetical protein n=1 Tax=Caenispirillum salinarum TaxID=859058 RepID=UPI00385106BE